VETVQQQPPDSALAPSTGHASEGRGMQGAADHDGAVPQALQRLPATLQPHGNLLKYYMLTALLFGPGFIFAVVPLYMRFRTLRYDVDAEGITMRWGVLFRREISLTYTRIQDIQLSSNVVERWLGLARIQLQTASGSASAEMTIEGVPDVESMRDFLYSRMRGAGAMRGAATAGDAPLAGGSAATSVLPAAGGAVTADAADLGTLTATLDAVADEVRQLRLLLARDTQDPRGGDA
jgi:membrane protein YdbS with pleckstrin-like domain